MHTYICFYVPTPWCVFTVNILAARYLVEKTLTLEPNELQFEFEQYQFMYLALSKLLLWMINFMLF